MNDNIDVGDSALLSSSSSRSPIGDLSKSRSRSPRSRTLERRDSWLSSSTTKQQFTDTQSQVKCKEIKSPHKFRSKSVEPGSSRLLSPKINSSKPAVKIKSFEIDSAIGETNSLEQEDNSPLVTASERRLRKEKALGALCIKFVKFAEEYAAKNNGELTLPAVAELMGEERRRIYDIVNVLEALEVLSKKSRCTYFWHGMGQLPNLIAVLAKEAVEQQVAELYKRAEFCMNQMKPLSESEPGQEVVGSWVEVGKNIPVGTRTLHNSVRASLSSLCRRFLIVLLGARTITDEKVHWVSLDIASTILYKDPSKEEYVAPPRARCRRLYDVANVLIALKLIKRGHFIYGTRKTAGFLYCGPEPTKKVSETGSSVQHSTSSHIRYSHSNPTATPNMPDSVQEDSQQKSSLASSENFRSENQLLSGSGSLIQDSSSSSSRPLARIDNIIESDHASARNQNMPPPVFSTLNLAEKRAFNQLNYTLNSPKTFGTQDLSLSPEQLLAYFTCAMQTGQLPVGSAFPGSSVLSLNNFNLPSVPPYSYQLYQPGYINPQFFYAQSGINQPKNDMGPDGNQK